MKVDRKTVVNKIASYLHGDIELEELVDWAEEAMMEAEFDEKDMDEISESVARLGLADVRAFGLTWEDCTRILGKLGHSAQVKITAA